MSTISSLRPDPALSDGTSSPFGGQIVKESVGQQAYGAIRNSLMRSRLKPGQKLVARQVADELGISVTPVRESLLRLVSEHALTLDERGTVVVPVLSLEQCIEIRDLRMLLEGEGAARAAKLVTDADIDELQSVHNRYVETETEQNFSAALAENENFHFGVCRLARSPALFGVVENLWMQFGPTLSYLYDSQSRPFHGQKHGHVRIMEALRKRDPELARKAMSQDILIGGKTLLEKLKT
ncbi:GntR family transcriptional regulator [Bradyrhizobium septentrionale]|uniref:GntR family transcriptional regulator n=1 Tax=Bradyrhizobium septentrionale TaxID=1404411 RepID=A0A973W7I7_9BRAD|nr:GntR family transcriptional regulator [Bradyrhizobium septentrionale]UGY17686.1 GntR family transcriptional regulator [Bradyrhizobium septentrionale]UGY26423.1 GntR family transcriptional regulator [Bradyrhizobium septentrionale]